MSTTSPVLKKPKRGSTRNLESNQQEERVAFKVSVFVLIEPSAKAQSRTIEQISDEVLRAINSSLVRSDLRPIKREEGEDELQPKGTSVKEAATRERLPVPPPTTVRVRLLEQIPALGLQYVKSADKRRFIVDRDTEGRQELELGTAYDALVNLRGYVLSIQPSIASGKAKMCKKTSAGKKAQKKRPKGGEKESKSADVKSATSAHRSKVRRHVSQDGYVTYSSPVIPKHVTREQIEAAVAKCG